MQLVCDQCNCLDFKEYAHPLAVPQPEGRFLCSACCPRYVSAGSPETVPGDWHGGFPREEFNPEVDEAGNRPSNLSL